MTKKDVLELKRRFKKNECTFTRMCGCYVNGEKNILLNLEETFLNLKDEEFYKYLEIARKALSGTIGNNLLELEFPLVEESAGGKQHFLMELKKSRLKNNALLDAFYQLIINTYDYAGNYLILVFHDAYDVITKTSDNNKLDESEEVYEYLLCAICPVTLTKPGLGYLEDENRIGPRNRDWVVGAPDTGFVFPAFTDRSTDIHSVMYYTRDAKEPHIEFVESGLGCPAKKTATQQKNTFQTIISNAVNDDEKSERILMDIQENLNQMVDQHAAFHDSKEDPMVLTNETIQNLLVESGLPEEITTKIETAYAEKFADEPAVAEHLIDNKVLAVSAQKKKEQHLEEQVQRLKERLEETTRNTGTTTKPDDMDASNDDNSNSDDNDTLDIDPDLNSNSVSDIDTDPLVSNEEIESTDTATSHTETGSLPNYDVILRVKPQKMEQIKSQIIDGRKCIIIPMDENEHANVNGVTTLL